MQEEKKKLILVVEDELQLAAVICEYLQQADFDTVIIDNGLEVVDSVKESSYSVVLLDIMLPGKDGRTLCQDIRSFSDVPIIMLTARTEDCDKISGLEGGADDYITKPFSPRELAARIKAVLRRRSPESADDVVEISELRLDPVTHRVTVNDHEVILGPTEFRLLYFLMTHTERVHSRSQLLDGVWGDHVFVEDRTVDVHIRRLRKILEPVGKDGLVQTVRGTGYRLSVGRP